MAEYREFDEFDLIDEPQVEQQDNDVDNLEQPIDESENSEQDPFLEDEQEQEEPKKLTFPGILDFLALLGVFYLFTVVGGFIANLKDVGSDNLGLYTFIVYLSAFGGTILFALPYSYFRSGRSFSPLKLSLRGFNMATLLWAFILILCLGVIIEPLLMKFDESYFEQLSSIMGAGEWFMLSALVVAPILEELLFRGVIQGAVANRYGAIVGVLTSSLIFGLIHINPIQVINAFFVGLVLGYVYYRTKTLWSVILLHFLNNSFSYVLWIFGGNSLKSLKQMIPNSQTYNIVYIISAAIFVVSFVFLFRALSKSNYDQTYNKSI